MTKTFSSKKIPYAYDKHQCSIHFLCIAEIFLHSNGIIFPSVIHTRIKHKSKEKHN